MRKQGLKMNPLNYAFGVIASSFLSFIAHKIGIAINQDKAKAIFKASPSLNKKQV